MRNWFKKLFCFHESWAKAGWKIYSAALNKNYWVCKKCGKVKNFGFDTSRIIAFENLPLNLDCTYETYTFPVKILEDL